jgi:hypothetical protein
LDGGPQPFTARERGLPIAWLHAGSDRLETLELISLGAEGEVTFERLPEGYD